MTKTGRPRLLASPFDRSGSHSLQLARERAPGPGHFVSTLAWCCRCKNDKPVLGSRRFNGGRLRVCADCSKPKEAAPC